MLFDMTSLKLVGVLFLCFFLVSISKASWDEPELSVSSDVSLVTSVWSPDQRVLYSLGSGRLIATNVQSENDIYQIDLPCNITRSISISPLGKFLAVGVIGYGESEQTTFLMKAETGELIHIYEYANPNGHPVFSPDGSYLLTGAGHLDNHTSVKIWSTNNGFYLVRQFDRPLSQYTGTVSDLAFDLSGEYIIVGYNDGISLVYCTSSGEITGALDGNISIQIPGQDILLCTNRSGELHTIEEIFIYDSNTWQRIGVWGDSKSIAGITAGPGGDSFAISSLDGSISIASYGERTILRTIQAQDLFYYPKNVFSPDSTLISTGRGYEENNSSVKVFSTGLTEFVSYRVYLYCILGGDNSVVSSNQDSLVDVADLVSKMFY